MYLAVVIDLYARRVVGWATSRRPDSELTLGALRMAIGIRWPPRGLVHHSDRGTQYVATAYQDELRKIGAVTSMSRVGDCYDNAVVESFFASYKKEEVRGRVYPSCANASLAAVNYIRWYNAHRLHTTNDYCSPNTYEEKTMCEGV
jgi:transposase InsO family protein